MDELLLLGVVIGGIWFYNRMYPPYSPGNAPVDTLPGQSSPSGSVPDVPHWEPPVHPETGSRLFGDPHDPSKGHEPGGFAGPPRVIGDPHIMDGPSTPVRGRDGRIAMYDTIARPQAPTTTRPRATSRTLATPTVQAITRRSNAQRNSQVITGRPLAKPDRPSTEYKLPRGVKFRG